MKINRKFQVTILLISMFSLTSCGQNAAKKTETPIAESVDSVVVENDEIPTYTPEYFDYSNTKMSAAYTDTVYAKFSDDLTEDRFTFYMPAGLVDKTTSVIRVINKAGELIYEHSFPTRDLVNGYATDGIKDDAEMEKYILTEAKQILDKSFTDVDHLNPEEYLSTAAEENFEDYEAFKALKNSDRVLFHYGLQEESLQFLAYSKKLKKVVSVISCC